MTTTLIPITAGQLCWTELCTRGRPIGATIYVPPTDAGTCVRFSSLQSPTGEVIVLYKSLKGT